MQLALLTACFELQYIPICIYTCNSPPNAVCWPSKDFCRNGKYSLQKRVRISRDNSQGGCLVWNQPDEIKARAILTADFAHVQLIGDGSIDEKVFGAIQKDRTKEIRP